MIVTVVMVDGKLEGDFIRIGGKIMRSWNGLIDVSLPNHDMYVKEKYTKIRNRDTREKLLILNDEYRSIDIC